MKVFLKRAQVAQRYSTTLRNTYLMEKDKRLPSPDLYLGKHALWSEETLEENERKATLRRRPSNTIANRLNDARLNKTG